MTLYYSHYQSPIGTLHLYAEKEHLVGVFLEGKHQSKIKANKIIKQTIKELDEYFSKKRTSFNIPLKNFWYRISKKCMERIAQNSLWINM